MEEKFKNKINQWFGKECKIIYFNDTVSEITACVTRQKGEETIISFVRLFAVGGHIEISVDRQINAKDLVDAKPATGSCSHWEIYPLPYER